jgi:hypothetical protein
VRRHASRLHRSYLALASLLLASGVGATAQALTGSRPSLEPIPMRRAVKAAGDVASMSAPALPKGADRIPPITFEMVVSAGGARSAKQMVTRTVDRLHLATREREWLFERNIQDQRRVYGFLIDHTSRTIVTYDESELRLLMGVRGWSDVLLLGFDAGALSQYTPTHMSRSIGGIRYTRYVAKTADVTPREIWWSEQHLLVHDFTFANQQGVARLSTGGARASIDRRVLDPPPVRFPAYAVTNVSDWLERH